MSLRNDLTERAVYIAFQEKKKRFFEQALQMGASNSGPDGKLLDAAKSGVLPKAQEAVTLGASIEGKDKEGNTALSLAVTNGYRLIIDWLINEKGANVNTKNNVSFLGLDLGDAHVIVRFGMLIAHNGHMANGWLYLYHAIHPLVLSHDSRPHLAFRVSFSHLPQRLQQRQQQHRTGVHPSCTPPAWDTSTSSNF